MTRDEFVKAYSEFSEIAEASAMKARKEGLLTFDGLLDKEKINARDIFEYGMSFVVDGVDKEIIDKILSNIIVQEKDTYTRTFKTIQKEAVLAIQQGFHSRIIYNILNSFTDIPLINDKVFPDTSSNDSDDLDLDT